MTSPMEYRVQGRAVHGGEAMVDALGVRVPLDAAWGTPSEELPGPAHLLGTAFAACMLKNLARAGALLDFGYERAEVDVVLRRQDTPPQFTEIIYEMRITTDEHQRRIDLVHSNLRKYGTVYNTLAAVCEVHGKVRAVT
jgi:uncharacterized OsmC-like protein